MFGSWHCILLSYVGMLQTSVRNAVSESSTFLCLPASLFQTMCHFAGQPARANGNCLISWWHQRQRSDCACGALVIHGYPTQISSDLGYSEQDTPAKTGSDYHFFGLYDANHPHRVTAEAQLDLPFRQGSVQSDGPAWWQCLLLSKGVQMSASPFAKEKQWKTKHGRWVCHGTLSCKCCQAEGLL